MKKFRLITWIFCLPLLVAAQQHIPEMDDYHRFLKSKTWW